MRTEGDRLYYETPAWNPYDPSALQGDGVPQAAADALSGRGLPNDACEVFVRNAEHELTVAKLPRAGPATFLADYTDQDNSFWVSLTDATIWMRRGKPDEPADDTQQINTGVEDLQAVLTAWCDLKATGLDENNEGEYEQAANITMITPSAATLPSSPTTRAGGPTSSSNSNSPCRARSPATRTSINSCTRTKSANGCSTTKASTTTTDPPASGASRGSVVDGRAALRAAVAMVRDHVPREHAAPDERPAARRFGGCAARAERARKRSRRAPCRSGPTDPAWPRRVASPRASPKFARPAALSRTLR